VWYAIKQLCLHASVAKLGTEAYNARHARTGPSTVQWLLVTSEKQ